MANTLYFKTTAADNTYTVHGDWEGGSSRGQEKMEEAGGASTASTVTASSFGATSEQRWTHRWETAALPAQTLDGDFTVTVDAYQSSTTGLNRACIALRVFDSGGTERITWGLGLDDLELTTSAQTITHTIAGPNGYTINENDRIVLEIGGHRSANGSHTTKVVSTSKLTYDGTGDLFNPGTPVTVNAGVMAASPASMINAIARTTELIDAEVGSDSWTESGLGADSNHGTDTTLSVVSTSNNRAWLKSTLDLTHGNVFQAELRVFKNSGPITGTSDIIVDAVDGTWAEGTITHNNQPSYGSQSAGTFGVASSDAAGTRYDINILDIVSDWKDGDLTNNGLVLRTAAVDGVTFRSTEHATTGERPRFYIILEAFSQLPPIDAAPATATGATLVDPVVSTNSNITAGVMAANPATIPGPQVGTGYTFSAGVGIIEAASLPMPTAQCVSNISVSPSADAFVDDDNATTNYSTTGNKNIFGDGPDALLMQFSGLTQPPSGGVTGGTLKMRSTGGQFTFNAKAYSIDASWTPGTVTWNTKPATGDWESAEIAFAGTGTYSLDVNTLVNEWFSGDRTNNGISFAYSSGAGVNAYRGVDASEGANPPLLEYSFTTNTGDKNISAAPATASAAVLVDPTVSLGNTQSPAPMLANPAEMVDPSIDYGVNLTDTPATVSAAVIVDPALTLGTGVNPTAAVATANPAELVDPTVSADFNYNFNASPAEANPALMVASGLNGTGPKLTVGVVGTATAESPDAGIGIGVRPAPMTATGEAITDPSLILGIEIVSAPMTATSKLIYSDFLYYAAIRGDTNWDYYNLFDSRFYQESGGYEGDAPTSADVMSVRSGTNFNGNTWVPGLQNNQNPFTDYVEMSFRTTVSDQILFDCVEWNKDVRLEDGKPLGKGSVRVDDGEWHHVIIQRADRNLGGIFDGTAYELWIDGKRTSRWRDTDNKRFWPSTIGRSRSGETFVGDWDFFGWKGHGNLNDYDYSKSAHDIQQRYYDWKEYAPIRAGVMKATDAQFVDPASARGNEIRILALSNQGAYTNITQQTLGEDSPIWVPLFAGKDQSGTQVAIRHGEVVSTNGHKFNDARMFWAMMRDIAVEDDYPRRRLINLQTDLDITDFDVIFVVDAPDTNAIGGPGSSEKDLEDFADSLRAAIDTGIPCFIFEPHLAVLMGLVEEGADLHSTPNKQDIAGHDKYVYDVIGSDQFEYVDNGENVSAPPENELYDVHYLWKERVLNEVAGITDLSGHTQIANNGDEVAYWLEGRAQDAIKDENFIYNLDVNKLLAVGDEIGFTAYPLQFEKIKKTFYREYRLWENWGIRNAGVVGTPLTGGQAQYYDDDLEAMTDSPAKDWIFSWVVEEGTEVKGSPIGGRVAVNLNSIRLHPETIRANNGPLPNGDPALDTGWDYDGRRSATILEVISKVNAETGEIEFIFPTLSSGENKGTSVPYTHLAIPYRQWKWLESVALENVDGVVNKNALKATATATMVNPTVTPQTHATIGAQAMLATGRIVDPDEASNPDVTINPLPMTASANSPTVVKTVRPAPMAATGNNIPFASAANLTTIINGIPMTIRNVSAAVYVLKE